MEQNKNTKVVLRKLTIDFLERCVKTIKKRKNNLSKISVKTIGHFFARRKKRNSTYSSFYSYKLKMDHGSKCKVLILE